MDIATSKTSPKDENPQKRGVLGTSNHHESGRNRPMERERRGCLLHHILQYRAGLPNYDRRLQHCTRNVEQATLQYAETSAAKASLLLEKFHQYKMDPDHSIMAHINRLRMMADELKSVGTAIDDLTVLVRIFQTLPPSYRYFISAWESVPRSEQTLTTLTARLITEELRGKNYGVDPADTAFFASHPSRIQQQSAANAAQSKAASYNQTLNYSDDRRTHLHEAA